MTDPISEVAPDSPRPDSLGGSEELALTPEDVVTKLRLAYEFDRGGRLSRPVTITDEPVMFEDPTFFRRAADLVENLSAALSEAEARAEAAEKRHEWLEFHKDQCGAAHELLDALSVPETEDGKQLNLAERISWTMMHDDYEDPIKAADVILSASSNPAWHNIQRDKAEAELEAERSRSSRIEAWATDEAFLDHGPWKSEEIRVASEYGYLIAKREVQDILAAALQPDSKEGADAE